MGLYCTLYPAVVEKVLAHTQIHGSFVRDIFIEHFAGRGFVDDHADTLLKELVEEGKLETLQKAPTHSQAAFAGLTYSKAGYRSVGWAAGTREHYWYRVKK